jgi:hypothetical protein
VREHYHPCVGHGFRFALQSAPQDQQWLAVARRAEQLGYSALLMPDGLQLPSPIPALGIAAGADIVALAVGPLASRDVVARLAAGVRDAAGDRAPALEFAITIFVVGDEAPPWVQRFSGADADALIAHDSLAILRGSTREIADEPQRRRDALGCSYIIVNGTFIEQFAPVVELLAGR